MCDFLSLYRELQFSYFVGTAVNALNNTRYWGRGIRAVERGARCSSMVRAFAHGAVGRRIDPLIYFSFQPVLLDWCNKGRGMYYLVCGMMHIKEPLLLIGKSSLCGGSRFPLLLFEWSFTICLTPYNRK